MVVPFDSVGLGTKTIAIGGKDVRIHVVKLPRIISNILIGLLRTFRRSE